MSKTAIMQPYLFPYIGYWQVISAVDNYIIYDDVNFIKGGWINRNNILLNNKPHLFTIPLEKASPFKKINEINIKSDYTSIKKFLITVQNNYAKAPYIEQTLSLLKRIFDYSDRNLAKFSLNHIREINDFLDIKVNLVLSSSIKKDNNITGQDKVIKICQNFNTDSYINAIGGKDLYSKDEFLKNNIALKFLETKDIKYKQFNNHFIPNLSIIDLMMFNSKSQLKTILKSYKLI